jgi:hypothetical protein
VIPFGIEAQIFRYRPLDCAPASKDVAIEIESRFGEEAQNALSEHPEAWNPKAAG